MGIGLELEIRVRGKGLGFRVSIIQTYLSLYRACCFVDRHLQKTSNTLYNNTKTATIQQQQQQRQQTSSKSLNYKSNI